MPTSNTQVNLPVEQSELMQWQEVAEEENQALTHFIRLAVREKLERMGYKPSAYEYKSGQKKGR